MCVCTYSAILLQTRNNNAMCRADNWRYQPDLIISLSLAFQLSIKKKRQWTQPMLVFWLIVIALSLLLFHASAANCVSILTVHNKKAINLNIFHTESAEWNSIMHANNNLIAYMSTIEYFSLGKRIFRHLLKYQWCTVHTLHHHKRMYWIIP